MGRRIALHRCHSVLYSYNLWFGRWVMVASLDDDRIYIDYGYGFESGH